MQVPVKKLFFILISFFFYVKSDAQSYHFRHYQVENGLSNNSAICCLQDRKGFLWFGTKDGLNRFDGYTFKIFRNDPADSTSISSNFIRSLFEDKDGVLWIGAGSGLNRYDARTESFSKFKETQLSDIKEITEDKAGNLWFIANFTLCKFNKAAQKLFWYKSDTYFTATSISVAANGEVWASSAKGFVYRYNPVKNDFTGYDVFSRSPKANFKWIEKICFTEAGKLLVGTSHFGVKIFDLNQRNYQDILTYNPDHTGIYVRNFIQVKPDEFWIGTESGIYIYNTSSGSIQQLTKKYDDDSSLSNNAVYAFCKDKEGGIWVTTYFGGINFYPKQYTSFTRYIPMLNQNSITGNVVREIRQDDFNNLWIGTDDAGLNKLDTRTGRFTHFAANGSADHLSYSNIQGLLPDHENLWIGTFEHGLNVMDIKTGKVKKHYVAGTDNCNLKSNFVNSITKLKNGKIIFGTSLGAYQYNAETDNFELLPKMPAKAWYSYLFEDNQGLIWAATYKSGVIYYDPKTGKSENFRYDPHNPKSLPGDRVNSVFQDSKQQIWFATENGLCKLNRQSNDFKRYTTDDGLPSNFTLSILEDSKQNLWISTTKGLVRLDDNHNQITVFKDVNGIINDQFNFNSAYKSSNGTMYFGSVKGMISFNPAQFIENNYIPPVYITNFKIFNRDLPISSGNAELKKSILYTQQITLNHQQSTFSIDFAALSYTAPKMAEYAYMMDGLDQNWTVLKENRSVYFTDLAAGTYVFKVKNINNPKGWNNRETTLTIEILPPWWQSKLAYCFYLLFIGAAAATAVYLYHQITEEKNQRRFELLKIVKEKEVSEAKIEFFTNVAHEIRTPLSLIKGPLEKLIKKADQNQEPDKNLHIMERNTARLIELTDQLLDFRQTEASGFSLSFTETNITALLEETFNGFKTLAEQKGLDYKLHMPAAICFARVDRDAFSKILYNLFSNAIKYAAQKVSVQLAAVEKDDEYFKIEIRNDGFLIPVETSKKIFEPFYRLPETQSQKGTGIGLAISNTLVSLHKGELFLKSPSVSMNIFCLLMPLKQELS